RTHDAVCSSKYICSVFHEPFQTVITRPSGWSFAAPLHVTHELADPSARLAKACFALDEPEAHRAFAGGAAGRAGSDGDARGRQALARELDRAHPETLGQRPVDEHRRSGPFDGPTGIGQRIAERIAPPLVGCGEPARVLPVLERGDRGALNRFERSVVD